MTAWMADRDQPLWTRLGCGGSRWPRLILEEEGAGTPSGEAGAGEVLRGRGREGDQSSRGTGPRFSPLTRDGQSPPCRDLQSQNDAADLGAVGERGVSSQEWHSDSGAGVSGQGRATCRGPGLFFTSPTSNQTAFS